MRYIKYLVVAILALVLVTVAFANRQYVELTVLPQGLDIFIPVNAIVGPISMPLYAVVFGGVAVGVLIGFFWEYAREGRYRRNARDQRARRAELEGEVRKMKAEKNAGRDEVLVLLDETAPAARRA